MVEPKKVRLRLWGVLATASEAKIKKEVKECAKHFGVHPDQIEVELMTLDHKQDTDIDIRSKRGGVEGGTGRDSPDEEG